ncbi:MAG: M20 family metallo-hydrolase [Candidatus Anammoxibacter sp.]
MEANIERIEKTLEKLASFNQTPGEGITRLTFSPEYLAAQKFLVDEMRQLGMKVSITTHGNVRARLPGQSENLPPVMTGSHIDSVPHGGRFDGAIGVVASLEAMRVIVENRLSHLHPLELVIFTEEEGARFGSLLTGSKAAIGNLSEKQLAELKDNEGISYLDALKTLTVYNKSNKALKQGNIKAMIEVHIEQGVSLEQQGIPIGIVDRIAGACQLKVELKGVANHAGATSMADRIDALAGAAEIMTEVERIATSNAEALTVATVGYLHCEPGVANVIPGLVTFTLDIRDVDKKRLEIITEQIRAMIKTVSQRRRLDAKTQLLSQGHPIMLSSKIIQILEDVAKKQQVPYRRMVSGAVHDAAVLAEITDVGMLFVPSEGGRSHCPEEQTKLEHIKIATDILIEALIRLTSKGNCQPYVKNQKK